MSENDELLAKIGQLAGHINRHKGAQNGTSNHNTTQTRYQPYSQYHRGAVPRRGSGRGAHWTNPSITTSQTPIRGGPAIKRRHRTLVLNSKGSSTPPISKTPDEMDLTSTDEMSDTPNNSEPAPVWVSKTDRHMQLINTTVYDQQAQARAKAMEKTRLDKLKRRENREKTKLNTYMHRKQNTGTTADQSTSQHEILVNGIRYHLTAGGSKLVKFAEDAKKPTPKSVVVAGVTFLRSKSGNLWRSGYVKTSRKVKHNKISKPCKFFTQSGKCNRGKSCPYMHDPNRVAICPKFLHSTCPNGDSCDLSHEPTPNRVPACLHFLRGNCSNTECKYAHINVNPAAPICRAFAREGYCDLGSTCAKKHIWECPDFDETGVCNDKTCKLPHVEHAGKRRLAAAAAKEKAAGQQDSSDISSDEEDDQDLTFNSEDDIDSDSLTDDEVLIGTDEDNHEVSQQHDFIRF